MSDGDELQRVFDTTDHFLLLTAKSALDAAGIPCVVQGEAASQLFPLGAAGSSVTHRLTGTSLLVPAERAEEARELLAGHARPEPDDA